MQVLEKVVDAPVVVQRQVPGGEVPQIQVFDRLCETLSWATETGTHSAECV